MTRLTYRAVDYWALGILTHELLVGKPPFRDHDHMSTYNKILKGIDAVSIPSNVNRSANNFIRKLLRLSPSDRLGYQRTGVQEIRDHKSVDHRQLMKIYQDLLNRQFFSLYICRWFVGFNWEALRQMRLPAPIVPEVMTNTIEDYRNFQSLVLLFIHSFRYEITPIQETSRDIQRTENYHRMNFPVGIKTSN